MLENFFISSSELALITAVKGSYQPPFVATSYVIAFISAYIAIYLVCRAKNANLFGITRYSFFGGVIMGTGIWSMHFIGMLAYKMPMEHSYNIPLTLLSLAVAILFSLKVFANVTTESFKTANVLFNAPLMGIGIAAMHYIGMESMQMDGRIAYTAGIFWLSIAIAIALSACAMFILKSIYNQSSPHHSLYVLIAAIIGFAVCGLHYTGMEAAVFIPDADCRFGSNQSYVWLAASVTFFSLIIAFIGIFIIFKIATTEPKTKQNNLHWNSVYYILATFNILTIISCLYLSHLLAENFDKTLKVTKEWSDVQLELAAIEGELSMAYSHFSDTHTSTHESTNHSNDLGILKALEPIFTKLNRIDAKVQPLLKSTDVYSQLPKEDALWQAFSDLNVINRPLPDSTSPSNSEQTNPTTLPFAEDILQLAKEQKHRVSMAREAITLLLQHLRYQQEERNTNLKRFEYLIMGLLGMLVLLTTFLGRSIALQANQEQEEQKRFQEELQQSRDNLGKQIEEQTREIRAESIKNTLLGKIAETSNQSRTIEAALKGCLKEVVNFSGWTLGHCYLKMNDAEQTVNAWYSTTNHNEYSSFINKTETLLEEGDSYIVRGLSLTNNQATWIEDIRAHKNFSRKAAAEEVGLKGLTAVPIIMHGKYLGFMEFFSNDTILPSFETVLILERLSMMIGRVVEKFINQHSLEVAKEHAEAASKAKTEFLSNMSHELRTPMHAILRFSENGMDEIGQASNEELKEYFSDIHMSGSRLTKLINNLLDLSKLESGAPNINLSSASLASISNHAQKELQSLLNEKELTIETTYDENEPKIVVDSDKITQVVVNLISNAIKFSPVGSVIHISTRHIPALEGATEMLEYSIKDQGPGIPENEVDAIFDKFIQSTKTKTQAGGTGLGLSICREIIRLHQGKIWAQNNPDKGANFIFILPINQ